MPGPSSNTECCLCGTTIHEGNQFAKCMVNCRKHREEEWVCRNCKAEAVVTHYEVNVNRGVMNSGPSKLCFRAEVERIAELYTPVY